MTNREQGERLLREAERIFERELKAAFSQGDNNLTVRRAQEVVELTLKGALRFLAIDYPKVHDVGSIFAKEVKNKRLLVKEDDVKRIKRVSLWLAQARAPSFYGERDYVLEDAQEAFEDAAFTLNCLKSALSKIVGGEGKG